MAQSLTYSQYLLARDGQVAGRVAVILRDEGYVPVGEDADPIAWRYMADIAAQPGLAEAYHGALIADREEPGAADDVITDGMLLAAVVAVMGSVPGGGT